MDILGASAGLLLLSPLMALIALLIRLESRGTVFFRQSRVGLGFRSFRIYKFRTMRTVPGTDPMLITPENDGRITPVGRLLRRFKLDEIPQLLNVLVGDMGLVGPRPEVPLYVRRFQGEYAEILRVRPGMTDLASIRFRNEGEILAGCGNPQEEYVRRILPEKLRLARDYVRTISLAGDVSLILRTLVAVFRGSPNRSRRPPPAELERKV